MTHRVDRAKQLTNVMTSYIEYCNHFVRGDETPITRETFSNPYGYVEPVVSYISDWYDVLVVRVHAQDKEGPAVLTCYFDRAISSPEPSKPRHMYQEFDTEIHRIMKDGELIFDGYKDTLKVLEGLMNQLMDAKADAAMVRHVNETYAFINAVSKHVGMPD